MLHVSVVDTVIFAQIWILTPIKFFMFFFSPSLTVVYNSEQSAPPPFLQRSQNTEGAMMTPSQRTLLFCLQGKELGCRGVF